MSLTIQLDETESARMSDELVEPQLPDRVEFVATGLLTISGELLGEFEGTTLLPAEVVLSVDDSETVTVDLTAEPSLRLEEVDVGVATSGADDISPGTAALDPRSDERADAPDVGPGSIAFTVEGAILNVPEETVDQLSEGDVTLQSITFALDETVKSDGGSNDAVVLEVTLLGYGIVVYRNGIVEIGTAGDETDSGLL